MSKNALPRGGAVTARGDNAMSELACSAHLPPISLRNDAKVQRGATPKCIKVYRSVLKCIVTYPNVLKCIETYQTVSKRIKLYRSVSKRIKLYRSVSKRIETYRNVSKRIKVYYRLRLPEVIRVYRNQSDCFRLVLIGSDWFRCNRLCQILLLDATAHRTAAQLLLFSERIRLIPIEPLHPSYTP